MNHSAASSEACHRAHGSAAGTAGRGCEAAGVRGEPRRRRRPGGAAAGAGARGAVLRRGGHAAQRGRPRARRRHAQPGRLALVGSSSLCTYIHWMPADEFSNMCLSSFRSVPWSLRIPVAAHNCIGGAGRPSSACLSRRLRFLDRSKPPLQLQDFIRRITMSQECH